MRSFLTITLLLAGLANAVGADTRLPRAQYKNGVDVRTAYQSVVADASRATVRVTCDGRTVALGAVVDPNGGVLTKGSQLTGMITCQLPDGRVREARIVGIDDKLDLAYLKVDATDLPVVSWERGGTPAVGQMLATAGVEETPVAVGVVSVPRRRLPEQRGMLGITSEETEDGTPGARILRILPKSGADEAGLQVGDVIRRVAGTEVKTLEGMAEAIGRHEPGATIELQLSRGEETVMLQATLGHPTPDILTRGGFMNHLGGRLSRRRTGFPPVLQHDTVLAPEECGGPVVSLSGKVVGINIARAGRTETYALPADEILAVLEDLRSGRLAPPTKVSSVDSGPMPPALPEK